MVSAELLARLELRCRELIRDISARKFASNRGDARCFGGLKASASLGDLWQLPPPRGTFLGEVPWELNKRQSSNKKLAQTIHGQELIWGYGGQGIQGMTELVQCERTQDEWLQEPAGPATARPTVRWKPRPLAWPHDENTRKCVQRTCDLRASKLSTPAATAAASKQRLRAGMRCLQNANVTSQGISVAWKAWGGRLRRSGRDFANEPPWSITSIQVCAHRNGQNSTKKECDMQLAKTAFRPAAIARKTGLNEWKIGTGSKGMIRNVAACTGYFLFAWASQSAPQTHIDRAKGILRGCRGVVVGWSQEPVAESCEQAEAIIWNALPVAIYVRFDTSYQMGCRWLTAGERVSGLPHSGSNGTSTNTGNGRCWGVTRRQYPVSTGFCGYRTLPRKAKQHKARS